MESPIQKIDSFDTEGARVFQKIEQRCRRSTMLCLSEKESCMILAMLCCRPFYFDISRYSWQGFCYSCCVTSFVNVSLLEAFCSSFFAGQRRTAEKAAAGSGEEREGLGMEVDGNMF